MADIFSRTGLILGEDSLSKLSKAHVSVFGIGGVGGYVCEGLARCGVGCFDLIDNDTVSVTNINRQIIALQDTVGKYKADVMRDRILNINPQAEVNVRKEFFLPENSSTFDFSSYDYVIDAVDMVTAKLEIISCAKAAGVPIISCMGTGCKLDPTAFRITDISQTRYDHLARIMRKELRKRGIENVKVLYSEELPVKNEYDTGEELPEGRRAIPGSVAFVPSVAGMIIAGEVIKDLCGINK